MIGLLISVVVLALVVAVVLWLLAYLGAPDIVRKVVVVLAVLIFLLMLLDAFGVVGTGVYYRGERVD
jgi:hypothetical protein